MKPLLFAAALLLGGLLAGCGTNPLCGRVACDCASPINARVSKVGGGSVPDVTLEGATIRSPTCSEDATSGVTYCFASAGVGDHAFDIKAPGYQTKRVEVTVNEGDPSSCCSCIGSELVEVTLDPA